MALLDFVCFATENNNNNMMLNGRYDNITELLQLEDNVEIITK